MNPESTDSGHNLCVVKDLIIEHLTRLSDHPETKTLFGVLSSENLCDLANPTIKRLQEIAHSGHAQVCTGGEATHCVCGKNIAEKFLQILQEAESGQRFEGIGPP